MTMATNTEQERAGSRTLAGRLTWIATTAALLALTVWAVNAGGPGEGEQEHRGESTVENVEGSEFSRVILTAHAVGRIGLEVNLVEPISHPAGSFSVPYAALVYGADGTTWVYATDGSQLSFRRQVVEVATVVGDRAILTSGPAVGTEIAGVGSVELYGTEFEVGH